MSTPNMNMNLPIVGSTIGPEWASQLNSSLNVVDAHDHSPGKGVPVTPAGLSISSDLSIIGNNLIAIRSSRYNSQMAPLALSNDLQCTYVSGVDLYYNDGAGNQIRLTQAGSVAGANGSIGGLVSPASANYNAGVFTWQQAANTPAAMDSGNVTVREQVANGNGATLQVPTALASDYTITLPLVPASTKIMIMDSSGNQSAAYVTDNSTLEVSTNTLQVKASGITATQLASNSVTTAKLADGAVTQPKMYTRTSSTTAPAGGICSDIASSISVTNAGFVGTGCGGTLVSSGKFLMVQMSIINSVMAAGSDQPAYRVRVEQPGTSYVFTNNLPQTQMNTAISAIIGAVAPGATLTFEIEMTSGGAGSTLTADNAYLTVYEVN